MNPLGPPDSYLADMLMRTLTYSVTTLSALLLLGVVVYVVMVVELLRGNTPRATPRVPGGPSPRALTPRAGRAHHWLRPRKAG